MTTTILYEGSMPNVNELAVYAKAHEVTLCIYRETRQLPTSERYGLIAQMRRSASSIPMNIAEGCGRDSDAELARFAAIAQGSAAELAYQLRLCIDLSYLSAETVAPLVDSVEEVRRMLYGLRRSLLAAAAR